MRFLGSETGIASASAQTPAALNSSMIRPVATEIALFLLPFALYAIYLAATRAGVLHPDAWSLSTLMWLTIAALGLMLGSFLVLAHFTGDAPNSQYIPAHIEDGKLVPGTSK